MRYFIVFLIFAVFSIYSKNYSFRNLSHVKDFFEPIAKETVHISVNENIPPAAVLGIAALESGFGSGYVSKVTGNILSLGARKGEAELPALYLPYSKKEKRVILDTINFKRSPLDTITYSLRSPSLKKDYRPKPYAGTLDSILYFSKNRVAFTKAKINNIEDFCKSWISSKSKVPLFREAKAWCDSVVRKDGKKALFREDIVTGFISKIGGKPRSFNFREDWPVKVKKIINSAGLIPLCKDLYISKKSFEIIWSSNE
ncbi:MAG: hypothetical protein CR982_03195 [Candidatus Cloacimonadota bacterium]|nr:MAG: hypothetical protein CR982_03195 [Candidatus Cloacimonadota bacterium]PIE77418.1 MAG: hypothetical protein CSA15_13135 [Candidatus Delongbacteria bacterium]